MVDSGKPFSQTGEATVTVFVEDVNDKRPKFERKSYTVYALESTPIGADVLRYVQRWICIARQQPGRKFSQPRDHCLAHH